MVKLSHEWCRWGWLCFLRHRFPVLSARPVALSCKLRPEHFPTPGLTWPPAARFLAGERSQSADWSPCLYFRSGQSSLSAAAMLFAQPKPSHFMFLFRVVFHHNKNEDPDSPPQGHPRPGRLLWEVSATQPPSVPPACRLPPFSGPPSSSSPLLGLWGFPGGSAVKDLPAVQEPMETRLAPWVGKIPWRRAWQPTPVFLPGEPQGKESLVGYSSRGRRARCDWQLVTRLGGSSPGSQPRSLP